MSEIDFAEIEKAMAELVNKAQGKERQVGLGKVAKERSQIAKQAETAQEQGDIATKRIIVASNKLRSSPHPQIKPPFVPASSGPGKVMDFVAPAPTYKSPPAVLRPQSIPPAPEEEIQPRAEAYESDLQKTVGDLSNQYLVGQVSEPEEDITKETKQEIEQEIEQSLQAESDSKTNQEVDDDVVVGVEEAEDQNLTSNTDDHKQTDGKRKQIDLEDLTGPSPVMSSVQEPTISELPSGAEDEHHDELPEADDLAEQVGKVHKIYGQKLPKEYLKKDKRNHSRQSQPQNQTSTNKNKQSKKRGATFYFVWLMVLASFTVWAIAAYLYFAA